MTTKKNEYRKAKRLEAIEYLGGHCVVCGTTERLEFDHIDPEQKEFSIAMNVNRKFEDLKPELDKCQLLCRAHHLDKTIAYRNRNGTKPIVHGTAYAYRHKKCRCDLCRAYNVRIAVEYKKRKRAEALASAHDLG